MDTYEHVLKQMTEYRAPTGMPEDWGLYPKSVRPANATEAPTPISRTARLVEHERGAALLVTDGSGVPLYIPRTEAQILQMIEDCAHILSILRSRHVASSKS